MIGWKFEGYTIEPVPTKGNRFSPVLKRHDRKVYEGVKVNFCAFLTTALDVGKWPSLHTSHFAPGKIAPSIHQIGCETVGPVSSQYQ
jgi:hypothetical protein